MVDVGSRYHKTRLQTSADADPAQPGRSQFRALDAEVDSFVQIPQARAKFKVTGKGLAVVVVDTGVNPRHISFQGQLLPGKNFSTQGMADDTTDFDGHGSNVAGIIAAKQVAPSEGMPTGIAPEAKIIPVKVFPGGGFDKLNEALQFVLDNIDDYKTRFGVTISAVNMSLGTGDNLQNDSGIANPDLETARADRQAQGQEHRRDRRGRERLLLVQPCARHGVSRDLSRDGERGRGLRHEYRTQ